jgi:hypothetical protein
MLNTMETFPEYDSEQIETQAEMRRHVRWAIGFDENTGYSTTYGDMLLVKLQLIYAQFDNEAATEEAHIAELRAMPEEVDPANFYATSAQSRIGQTGVLTGDMGTGDSSSMSRRGGPAARRTRQQLTRGGGRVGRPRGARGVRARGAGRGTC